MYKIYFNHTLFATVPDIENACALALSVHRSSNTEHTVEVCLNSSDDVCLKGHTIITFSFVKPVKNKE